MAVRPWPQPGRTAAPDPSSIGEHVHRWLAWSVWLLCLVALASFVPTLQPTVLDVAAGLSWMVGVLAVATIGALVVSRRRSRVQGWLLAAFAMSLSAGLSIYNYLRLPGVDASADLETARLLVAIADTSTATGVHALFLLLLVVPDGRLPARRWRPVVWLVGVSAVLEIWTVVDQAMRIVDIDVWLGRPNWVSTAGLQESSDSFAPVSIDTFFVVSSVVVGLLVVGLVMRALWTRLAAGPGVGRQQVKWMALGTFAIACWPVIWLPQPQDGWMVAVQRVYPGIALTVLAAGFGMALFKYRLWDIDLVVRRSLVYGVLWLVIAAMYAGVAAGFGLAAGTRFPVGVAVVLTVVATLMFQPARRALERVADRTVFGRKDSAAGALHTFREGVAASARPDDIASELAATATAALGLAWAAVEIGGAVAAEFGAKNPEPEVVVSVAWRDEQFGRLRCQPRRTVRLSNEDMTLLDALAGQTALALSHARLAARIVHAQEGERRRIERNIHDGAQQELASLVARLGVTRAGAGEDSPFAQTLDVIQQEIQRVLAELRALAQGIHPSVLRDGGLVAAIEDRCSRLPIDVNLGVDEALHGRRLPTDVETAAYFFVAEAVANTLKHSGSPTVDIAIELDETHLKVGVADAGTGFDPRDVTTGSGITGLTDRIRAVGGRMTVDSRPGHGTLLAAELPV